MVEELLLFCLLQFLKISQKVLENPLKYSKLTHVKSLHGDQKKKRK